jgi:hypothetical protein
MLVVSIAMSIAMALLTFRFLDERARSKTRA